MTGKVCPAPTIIEVPVPYYVPVDSALTAPLEVPKGSLADIPAVARKRREVIEQCNIDRAAVGKLQGTAVPAGSKP